VGRSLRKAGKGQDPKCNLGLVESVSLGCFPSGSRSLGPNHETEGFLINLFAPNKFFLSRLINFVGYRRGPGGGGTPSKNLPARTRGFCSIGGAGGLCTGSSPFGFFLSQGEFFQKTF